MHPSINEDDIQERVWNLNGTQLNSSDTSNNIIFLNNNKTIKFMSVNKKHNGNYECIIRLNKDDQEIYSDQMKLLVLNEYETFSVQLKVSDEHRNETFLIRIFLNEKPSGNLNNELLGFVTGNQLAYKVINPPSHIYQGIYSFYVLNTSNSNIVDKAYLSTVFLGK
jgi:hypothetical protein